MNVDVTGAGAWRKRFITVFVLILVGVPLAVAGWAWVTLRFAYARGERAGYVQKISQKGWLCKTWEGELAMANLPGAMPEIFQFSVRDEAVAAQVTQYAGQRVALSYEQHRGVPTSCFGETEYFVTRIVPISDSNAAPAAASAPATPNK